MARGDPHNVFISHYHGDVEELGNLRELLRRSGFNLRDSSVDGSEPNNANSPEYIKSLLRPQIDWAGTMIVLIGPRTYERPWVEWEIEHAHREGKRIVGVYVRGAKDSDLPQALDRYGDALVGWNSENIIAAMQGSQNSWLTPAGQPRPPAFNSHRENC